MHEEVRELGTRPWKYKEYLNPKRQMPRLLKQPLHLLELQFQLRLQDFSFHRQKKKAEHQPHLFLQDNPASLLSSNR